MGSVNPRVDGRRELSAAGRLRCARPA